MKQLKIQMLGAFSISCDDIVIDANNNRSRKTWMLLAYLIHNKNRVVTQEELVDLLWEGGEGQENSSGALNTVLWRARQVLNPISEALGQNLIVRKSGGYIWNPEVPMVVDTLEFETLYQQGRDYEDEDLKLDEYRKALGLYQGSFLTKLVAGSWINMVSVYYSNVYLNILMEALPLLLEREYYQELEAHCQTALQMDPYNEAIYQYQIRSFIARNDFDEASAAYERMRECLFSQLGITPSEEMQQLYRDIQNNSSQYAVSPDVIRDQLREDTPIAGAIVCDYSFFKFFYQAEARSAVRRGDAVHVAVLSVTDAHGKELASRSLDRAMENLRIQLQRSLRKSDVISRCSESQYVALLLQANYENSCKVCERVIQAFNRSYPHSPAQIHYVVMPLEPVATR